MTASRARIEVPREQIADFCRRHHIRWLPLFGSVLRDDFRPDSDIDVLVEFEPGRRIRTSRWRSSKKNSRAFWAARSISTYRSRSIRSSVTWGVSKSPSDLQDVLRAVAH